LRSIFVTPATVACRKLISFRLRLEVVTWLLALVPFVFLSLYGQIPNPKLLAPFIIVTYVIRGCAWWIVGGEGLPKLARFFPSAGMNLFGLRRVLWAILGLVASATVDLAVFVGLGFAISFRFWWDT